MNINKRFIVRVKGDCMDSPEAPMRIKDKSELCVYSTPVAIREAKKATNKVVCVATSIGFYCKHLTSVNIRKAEISLTAYNPFKMTLTIPFAEVKELFVVTGFFRTIKNITKPIEYPTTPGNAPNFALSLLGEELTAQRKKRR